MISWIYFWIAAFRTKYKTSRKDYVITMGINIAIVIMVTIFFTNSVMSTINVASDTNMSFDVPSIGEKITQLYEIQPNVQKYIADAYSGKAQSSQSFNQLLDRYGSEDVAKIITLAWFADEEVKYESPEEKMMVHDICAELNARYDLMGKNKTLRSDIVKVALRLNLNEQQTELNNIIEQELNEKFVAAYNKMITLLKVLAGLLALLFIPTVTLTVRRLRDIGANIGVIPVLIISILPMGILVLAILCLMPSNRLGNATEQYYY